ncbi:MAG: hypothetical protein Q4C91_20405 [Eubacteriales bacterium]|nr:hypothetical protein [Eubacteriales bacterium]
MKKKLAILLSCSMLLTSILPVNAAEFSSGSSDTSFLSEESFTDDAINKDSINSEIVNSDIDEADIFESDNTPKTQTDIETAENNTNLSTAGNFVELTSGSAYEILPGTGTVTYDEDEEEYMYKFIPPKDGDYTFTFSYDGKNPVEYSFLYPNADKKNALDEINISENTLRFNSLKGGQAYYFYTLIMWWGTNRSVTLRTEDITAELVPEIPYEIPDYLEDDTLLKFSPTQSGYYYLTFSDGVSYSYDVYQGLDGVLLSSTWLDVLKQDAYLLNAGKTYYFAITPDDFHSVTLFKGKTDQEMIADLFEASKPLTVLQEAIETSVTFVPDRNDNADKEAFLEFTPGRTAEYLFFNKTPAGEYDSVSLRVYDESFNFVTDLTIYNSDNTRNLPVSLNAGTQYYIRASKKYNGDTLPSDTSKLLITAKPRISSLRIVSGPSRKTLYAGIDVTAECEGGLHLPGLVLEAAYEDGYTETIDIQLYGTKVYLTKCGDILSCRLNDIDYVQTDPPAGTYSATITIGDQNLIINDITIKERAKLPTINKQGKGSAAITSYKAGYIRLKTGSASKYKITVASDDATYPASFSIYKEADMANSLKTQVPSGTSLLLDPGSSYIIRTGQDTGYTKYTVSKITVTATPSDAMNMSSCTITLPSTAAYTGKGLSPAVTVKYGSRKLTKGKDYTVTYKNNTNFGTATAIITGKGSYKGKVTKTFKIVPAVPSGFKATKSASALKLQWKKAAGASGYEVYLYKNSKWTKVKTTTGLTYTTKAVKKGTTYKYKVRAYRTVKGKKIYGSYTSAKSVKF